MESPASLIESLLEGAETYAKTAYELSKLKTLERITAATTALVARASVLFVICMFALILSIGMALWLGEMLGKPYYGFFIVAAFYLVLGIVTHFFLHQWIKKPVSDSIITHLLQ